MKTREVCCRVCGSQPGQPCIALSGRRKPLTWYHWPRQEVAKAVTAAAPLGVVLGTEEKDGNT